MSFETIASHLVYTRPLDPESVVVDGGAHKGWFASKLSERFGCRCYGFEPSADLFATLQSNERITYARTALCGRTGPLSFAARVSADNPMGNALTHLKPDWEGTADVVEGLDFLSLLHAVGGRIDLLKLDIEGAEIEFLDKAPDQELSQVDQLTIEFHDHCGITPRAEVVRVCSRLRALGFYRLWTSWRENTHDTLFVHRRLLSHTAFFWQMYPVRYWRAVGRVARRILFGGPSEDRQ